MFPARFAHLRELRGFLERFCEASGVAREDGLRLNLVLEELFTNTVQHGHGGGSDAPVWLTLGRADGGVTIVYEDAAPPFNPLARTVDVDLPVEERPVGGLGVLLTREIMATCEYAYLYGRNRIRMRFGGHGAAGAGTHR